MVLIKCTESLFWAGTREKLVKRGRQALMTDVFVCVGWSKFWNLAKIRYLVSENLVVGQIAFINRICLEVGRQSLSAPEFDYSFHIRQTFQRWTKPNRFSVKVSLAKSVKACSVNHVLLALILLPIIMLLSGPACLHVCVSEEEAPLTSWLQRPMTNRVM